MVQNISDYRKFKMLKYSMIVNMYITYINISELRTTQQGQVYFYHIPTGVSTWHDPRIPKDLAPLGLTLDQLGPLPPGWEMRQTASGRVSILYAH